jgi:toxin ParE1/3/4
MSFALSKEADADIRSIIEQGLDRFGVNQAMEYLDGLETAFQLLVDFPCVGSAREDFYKPYRFYPYKAHLIFYRRRGGDIFITRIRHAREDWQAA